MLSSSCAITNHRVAKLYKHVSEDVVFLVNARRLAFVIYSTSTNYLLGDYFDYEYETDDDMAKHMTQITEQSYTITISN